MADISTDTQDAINKILLTGESNGQDAPNVAADNISREDLKVAAVNKHLLSTLENNQEERKNDIISLEKKSIQDALAAILNCGGDFVMAVRNLTTAGVTIDQICLQTEDNQGDNDVVSRTEVTVPVGDGAVVSGGGNLESNYSETSSINGSFLNNRMNRHLRHSMLGGSRKGESDTLADITELQMGMPAYRAQSGGNRNASESNNDFMKRMHDMGITSSTSDFCD